MNILQKFEQEQVNKLASGKKLDEFKPGDTVCVNVKIIEGENERVQAFEGVCIARKNAGLNSSFTVRKISHGEGVERIFPLYSPRIDSIKLVRSGDVSRAKLYYLRDLSGKAARIKEKLAILGVDETAIASNQNLEEDNNSSSGEVQAAPAAKAEAAKPAASKKAETKKKKA